MRARSFQVYGERCSGTNFIIRLLERNVSSAAFTEDYGFKHWFVDEDLTVPNDVLVLSVARDWTDWVRSFHRQPWHAHPSLRELSMPRFLRAEWHCVWDDDWYDLPENDPRRGREMMHERDPATGERFSNVLAMRQAKEANWARLRQRSAQAERVSYEAVSADPEGFLRRLADRHGLTLADTFVPVDSYKGQKRKEYVPKQYPPLSVEDAALVGRYAEADDAATQTAPRVVSVVRTAPVDARSEHRA